MGWMQKLCEVYDNCEDIVGVYGPNGEAPLLPSSHTLLTAPITVTLSPRGKLLTATVEPDTVGTISPCTEDSLARTGSTPCAHLLVDSLQYVAGDFSGYTGSDTSAYFQNYIEQLRMWCASPYKNDKVCAVLAYIEKGTLTADLIARGVLFTGDDGRLLQKWTGPKDEQPPIFTQKITDFAKAAVRFRIETPGEPDSALWTNPAVWKSAQDYSASLNPECSLCYISGEEWPAMHKHPKKIVRRQANAKLISAKDTNLKYRGRFQSEEQALSISAKASYKAHYALAWLAESRGVICDSETIIAFGTEGQQLPDPTLDDVGALFGLSESDETASDRILKADAATMRAYADKLNLAVKGLHHRSLAVDTPIVLLALDSSTSGRLAVTYYRELRYLEYEERIVCWHETCQWRIPYTDKSGKRGEYTGAPSNGRIVDAAYGRRQSVSDKVRKNTYLALMNCVFGGRPIPRELVQNAVHRASNPLGLQSKEADSLREWNETLAVACALYKKQHKKEDLPMALDENRPDRSYLFGRLLAAADQMERYAMQAGEDRPTNALRLMTVFSQHPVRVWAQISRNLVPYRTRLGKKGDYYENLITEITSRFQPEDFDPAHDKPLDGLYLLGYHSQRQIFLDHMREAKKNKEEAKNVTHE